MRATSTKSRIRKAVFPAAGFGTRFLPVTKAQPKEMLPIVDKPVIQYLVEEAVASGIEEIIIVTGRGKRAIEDHFDHSFELEHNLVEKGKTGLLKEVRHISDMAKFIYVRQPLPLGDGHAILCAKEIIGNEPFAVLFGDDLIRGKKPALKQLIEIFEKKKGSVMALEKIDKKNSEQYGMVDILEKNGKLTTIKNLVEKPQPENAPSNLAIIGKYVLTPEIIPILEKIKPGKDGEIRLIQALQELLKQQNIYGYEVEGVRYDTGSKFGFLKATIDFALERKDLGHTLRSYLRGLDLS
ncbi:UTP--glucose-1-phosphate uridylyltransferase GalU [Candidatus Peregrinibacteria bacterium]|nr:UTP--glucose-1-phosphate uridylyltransferase GalU [Candidatus Peregrinibacteria bacterium]